MDRWFDAAGAHATPRCGAGKRACGVAVTANPQLDYVFCCAQSVAVVLAGAGSDVAGAMRASKPLDGGNDGACSVLHRDRATPQR